MKRKHRGSDDAIPFHAWYFGRPPKPVSDILTEVGVTPKTAAVGSIITAKEETEIKKCILFC